MVPNREIANEDRLLDAGEEPRRILIVDDIEQNRMLLGLMVQSLGHQVVEAASGAEALKKLHDGIDLVLLDVMMPGLDGFEVVRQIRSRREASDVPVIMVTALDSREASLRSLEVGASDFIAKPVDNTELRLRLRSQLRLKGVQDEIKRHGTELEAAIAERTRALRRALEEAVQQHHKADAAHLDGIHRLALAAGFRGVDTAGHIRRIGLYTAALGRALQLPAPEVDLLVRASPLHDIGKLAIADAILYKPGPLDADERRIVNSHTLIGGEILAGSSSEILQAAEVIALSHHERWDGTGYPRGLAGLEIPPWGRLCALSDAFDALTSDRPYRRALATGEALDLMRQSRGSQFDPELFDLFAANSGELKELRERPPSAESGLAAPPGRRR
jgi:cyclic di-GMP phosphodiesterase